MGTRSFQPVRLKWFLAVCNFLAALSVHAQPFTLTVNNGSGSGIYTNGAKVTITAIAPAGTAFTRWTGDTQCVAGVFSLSTIVTMPTQDAALTAVCENASNGVVNIDWRASGGFYFSADPSTGILGPFGSGKSTIAQLMYSPDAGKDSIFPNRAGAVNDVVWDTITLTEDGIPNSWSDWALFAGHSTVRTWTNGYVYALIFQGNDVQPGDWYYSTSLLALQKIPVGTLPQILEMNTDTYWGDAIDGAYGDQVDGVVLTVNNGTGSGSYTNGAQVAIAANAPAEGQLFDQWIGDTAYVNNVTYTNAVVTLTTNPVTLTATYKSFAGRYALTVNSGSGSGSYTNGRQVAISANTPAAGKAFYQWIGATQVVNNVTYTNALVTMSTNPVILTATYVDIYYALTVNSGSGSGSYTNTQLVEISADAPASGMTFDRWTGATQVVASVSSPSTTVMMPAQGITLTATYKILPGWYTLTVSNGNGSGIYSNGVRVTVTAIAPDGTAFTRWTGDTQYADGVVSLSTTVTMPAQDIALTATCEDASNGVVHIDWSASGGFYFSADPDSGILGPVSSGKSTIAQLMYSPDAVKDNIFPNKAGAANDVVWDTITLTENGQNWSDWAVFASHSTVRTWTNGYVYAVIFQDNNVQPGDWYYFTPLMALEKSATNTSPQSIEMNTDLDLGDAIDGAYGDQVNGVVLTVNSGSGSGSFYTNGQQVAIAADAPAEGLLFDQWTGDTQVVNNVTYTNAVVTLSTNPVTLTATYKEMPMPPQDPFRLWMAQYGLTNYEADAVLDQDSDGLATWQEYITGTDPTNTASCLKVAQTTRNIVTWSPVTGRVYSVYWSTNLMNGFQPLETNIVHPQSSYTNAAPDSRVNHYQIKVRLQ